MNDLILWLYQNHDYVELFLVAALVLIIFGFLYVYMFPETKTAVAVFIAMAVLLLVGAIVPSEPELEDVLVKRGLAVKTFELKNEN